MDSDEDDWVVPLLRTARAWGKPPLTLIAGRPEVWREEDTLLALAFEHYESTRVNELGIPRRITEAREHAKDFVVDDKTVDYSLRVLDEYRARQKGPGRPGIRPQVQYKPYQTRPDSLGHGRG